MKLKCTAIPADKLVLVATAESFANPHEPPLFTGNWVRLNSGGPNMLVVEASASAVIAAWKDDAGIVHEHAFPRACLHRLSW